MAGVSQARTWRSALGQETVRAGTGFSLPLSRVRGRGLRRVRLLLFLLGRGWIEAGVPAEAERAVDQGLMPPYGGVGAHLEIRPAQLVLDLLVALLDPVADAVDPGDLRQVRRWMFALA